MESFIIAVEFDVDGYEYDSLGILTKALQKSHNYNNEESVRLNSYSLHYNVLNSDVILERISCTYSTEIFKVQFNHYQEDGFELDDIQKIYDFVASAIKEITYYSYKSTYEFGANKKADIKILDIKKLIYE